MEGSDKPFAVGARVYLGDDPSRQAIIRAVHSTGTTSNPYPHYIVQVMGESGHTVVAMDRVRMLARRKDKP
jgi:hypothetical protein